MWRLVQGMGPCSSIRACLRATLAAGLLLSVPAAAAFADEATTDGLPVVSPRLAIHDAAETLRDWCVTDAQGLLWLVLPGGARYELVTSVSDDVITNPGDGSFHPFDALEVRTALATVSYPLDDVVADVFILPYPRRADLGSAAGPGLILLSPGVYPLPSTQQHAEAVHELGHVVQHAHLPDTDADGWSRYRTLRGIEDTSVYYDEAEHADQPHEIFAEDFRALFGGALATSTGTIENATLALPDQVPGLEDFLFSLAGARLTLALGAAPNPSRGAVAFSRAGTAPAALEVFDVAGRRLATLRPTTGADGGQRWSWDGRDDSGRRVGPGVVFARASDGSGTARVIVLP